MRSQNRLNAPEPTDRRRYTLNRHLFPLGCPQFRTHAGARDPDIRTPAPLFLGSQISYEDAQHNHYQVNGNDLVAKEGVFACAA